ncbi:MAG: phosphoenolpyruvate synthase, partial [Croceitalea sp.]|nr:phosphoenolpyruvate synthase [Croceitalea sp.]
MTNKLVVFLLVVFLFFTSSKAQKIDNRAIKELVSTLKNDIRGPYKDIRWFCTDGSIRAPKDPCPNEIGPGVQHARYKDQVEQLGKSNHLFLGQILAYTKYKDFWDAEHNHSRLKQYQIENYLKSIDNGWIHQKAQFYRGAIQAEDEQAWGLAFYLWLLENDQFIEQNFFLIRQSLKDVPHYNDDNVAQLMRSQSKVISDAYLPFMDLRVKIHGQPQASDITKVEAFKAANAAKLTGELNSQLDELLKTMAKFHRPIALSSLAKMVVLNKESALGMALQNFSGNEKLSQDPPALVKEASQLLLQIRQELLVQKNADVRLQLLEVSLKLEEMVFKGSLEWKPNTLKELLEKTCHLAMATTGSGYIELWEWDQLAQALTAYETQTMTLDQLTHILHRARGQVEWSASMVKANYDDVVQQYIAFEPLAAGFIDDKIRGSVALHLGQAVGQLGDFISNESALTNKVLGVSNQSTIRGLNPGYAFGELVVVDGLSDEIEVSSNKIYIFQRPPSDLKPVAGIATVAEGNMVSHVQ